jgi:hypothetical protein
MKNCDTCLNFLKIKTWNDKRKGLCEHTDYNICYLKRKPCKHYNPLKYIRKKQTNNSILNNEEKNN